MVTGRPSGLSTGPGGSLLLAVPLPRSPLGSSGLSSSPGDSPSVGGSGDCEVVGGVDEGVPDGVCDGGSELGSSDAGGSEEGAWDDGDSDGLCDGDRDCDGVVLGCTAAPCLVSSSNSLTPSMTPKVYAAQISAGKPPPLTRYGTPPALYIGTCARVLLSSPNSPTEVTSSGVKPLNQADLLLSDVPVLPATCWPPRSGLSRTDLRAVPSLTTPVSTDVTVSAAWRLMTCSPTGSGNSTVRVLCSADLTRAGVIFSPWLARVA